MISGVTFITTHISYACTNKTKILWIHVKRFIFYFYIYFFIFLPRASCLHACLDAMLLPQSYQYPNLLEGTDSISEQLDRDEEWSFSGITNSGSLEKSVSECVWYRHPPHNGSVADFRIRWAILNYWGGKGGGGGEVVAEPQQEPQPGVRAMLVYWRSAICDSDLRSELFIWDLSICLLHEEIKRFIFLFKPVYLDLSLSPESGADKEKSIQLLLLNETLRIECPDYTRNVLSEVSVHQTALDLALGCVQQCTHCPCDAALRSSWNSNSVVH